MYYYITYIANKVYTNLYNKISQWSFYLSSIQLKTLAGTLELLVAYNPSNCGEHGYEGA